MGGRSLEVTHVTSLQFSYENWVSQNCVQLILGLAGFLFSLCWASQGFCQLILDLAGFSTADFGSRKVFVS